MPKRRATAKDVAELAGVSRTTVSFVLNGVTDMRISDKTHRRVLDAARRLNYHPDATARRMVSGKTRQIGFVLRQSTEQVFADHFLPQFMRGLSQAASKQDYHILYETIPPEDQTGAYARLIRERHVDGLVLSGPRLDDRELLRFQEEGEPIVLAGQLPGSDIPYVDVDNTAGAAVAVRHLLGLGHRRIALITNAPLVYTASTDRLKGYRHALEKGGVEFDRSLVRYGGFTPQSGVIAMTDLLTTSPLPTAVFVASDTVALGALQAIRKVGLRVPEDIALVGFDDIPLAEFVEPSLTTIRLPAHRLGWTAADMLISLLNNASPKQQILLETELVVRESCGAKKAV